MKEISSAAAEQATGIQNISEAMSELDQSTHMNTNIAAKTSESSNSIDAEAGSLKVIVHKLEGIVQGSKKELHSTAKTTLVSKVADSSKVSHSTNSDKRAS